MTSRPPLTGQERAQIRALLRFLIIVLLAIAVASAAMGGVITLLNSGVATLDVTIAP